MVNQPFGAHFAGAPWIEEAKLTNKPRSSDKFFAAKKKNYKNPNKPRTNAQGLKMYFLLKMVIFQPAMLIY